MTTEVASLKVVFTGDDSQLRNTISGVKSNLQSTGGQLSGVGQQIGTGIMSGIGLGVGLGIAGVTAQIAGLGPAMLGAAADFDNALRNANSILQLTNAELAGVKDQLLGIGAESVAGPQMVANAYYEIVSAVADTSVHMDLLSASVRTAEAGQANLIGTTSSMISIMNAYSLEAKEAAHVSDLLTRTVGMGVGSMDAFGQAFSQIAGLGATLNISLDELGSELAFITTRGFSASEAATQLSSAMTAFINPSEKMKKQLQAMGYESGSALIKAHGLAGAMELLSEAVGGNVDSIADLLGRKEALQAFLSVTGDEFTEFFGDFTGGISGATEAARNMQLESVSQQWELFESKIEAVGIALGTEFLPAANAALDVLGLLVDVGGELLGVDFGVDKGAIEETKATLESDIAGTFNTPMEVTQSVTITIEPGEIPWNDWKANWSEVMDWPTYRAHYADAARAAGFSEVEATQKGISYSVLLEGKIDSSMQGSEVKGVYEGFREISASIHELNEATRQTDPTAVDKLNLALSDLVGYHVEIGWVADAFKDIADFVTPDGVADFFKEIGTQIGDIDFAGFVETADPSYLINGEEWEKAFEMIPTLIDTVQKGAALEWQEMQRDAKNAVNDIIESFNTLDDGILGQLGLNIDIKPLSTAEEDAAIARLEAELSGNPVQLAYTLGDSQLGALMGDMTGMSSLTLPVTPVIDPASLEETATYAANQFPEVDLYMDIAPSEESTQAVMDFGLVWDAFIGSKDDEPMNPSIAGNSFVQVGQLGADIDYATRDRSMWAQVNSNIGAVAYEINNTIADRIMRIDLQITSSSGGGGNMAIPAKALGGDVLAGETYLVGERGPELFTPESSGAIIPNSDLMALSSGGGSGSGGGGMTVVINGGLTLNGVQDAEGLYNQLVEIGHSRAYPGFSMDY